MSGPKTVDRCSERYASLGDEYLFGTAPNRFLQAQAHRLTPGQRALMGRAPRPRLRDGRPAGSRRGQVLHTDSWSF